MTENEVGSYHAKTHLSQLLDRVEHGESIFITRHGKPVAKLIPIAPGKVRADMQKVVEEMLTFRDRHGPKLDGLAVRELIEEGRR